jgi:hypothetical protein
MTHLDIEVDDLASAVAWAEQHGAVQADHQPQDWMPVRERLSAEFSRRRKEIRPADVRIGAACATHVRKHSRSRT